MTSLLSGSSKQQLSPQAILDRNYTFARTAILVASVRLRLFSHLANQALTPLELRRVVISGLGVVSPVGSGKIVVLVFSCRLQRQSLVEMVVA